MSAESARAEKSARSLIWILIFNLVTSGLPFVVRTAQLYLWGYNYVGLNSLFASVLNVLNITELGIGEALVFSLYRPMEEKNIEEVNGILNFYRKIYFCIGMIIGIAGIVLIPFLPFLIKQDMPSDVNITVLYIIALSNIVGGYWVLAYCHSIFQTNQSLYLTFKYNSFNYIIMYLVQILLIVSGHNYYLFALSQTFFTISAHCINYVLVKKHYPEYHPQGWVDKNFILELKKRLGGMVVRKLRNQFRATLDSVIISASIGLIVLAKYQNYYLIMIAVFILVSSFKSAILQSLGNSVVSESVESNYNVIRLFVFILQWTGGVCATVMLCDFHSIMLIWLRDESAVLPYFTEILFVIYYYFLSLTQVTDLLFNSTGIWWKDKWIPILETVVNLILNIVCVKFWGVNGILLATIVSIVFINIPFETRCIYKNYFCKNVIGDVLKYYLDAILNIIIMYSIFVLCNKIFGFSFKDLLLRTLFSFLVSNLFLLLFNLKNNKLKEILLLLKTIIKKKGI